MKLKTTRTLRLSKDNVEALLKEVLEKKYRKKISKTSPSLGTRYVEASDIRDPGVDKPIFKGYCVTFKD